MLSVLDKFSDRLIRIIHLLFQADGKVSFDDMLDILDTSEKTLYDDLNYINEHWKDIIEIDISDSFDICAPKMSMSSFLKLQSIILSDAVSIKIIKELFFHPNKKLNYYVEKLHLSSSTIYKYLHILDGYLKKYGITIENHHSYYYINGYNELAIRRFFTVLFSEVSGYTSKMFLPTDINELLKQRVITLCEVNNEKISPLLISFYADQYYFSILREMQGNRIEAPVTFKGIIPKFSEAVLFEFNKYFTNLNEDDFHRIESSFLTFRHSLNSYSDNNLSETIPRFINNIFKTFNLSTNKNEFEILLTYIKDLYISDILVNIPLHLTSNKYIYFTSEAIKNNSWAVSEIRHLVEHLSRESQSDFNRHIDYIIYLFITHLPDIMKNHLTRSVLVISEHSKQHAEFLCKTIQRELNLETPFFEHVNCIHKDELHLIDSNSYELIITNSFTTYQKIEALIINSYPSNEDIQSIKNYLIN